MRSDDPASRGESRRYEGCYGCGQANPHGLRLRFETVGDTVETTFTPEAAHQGYPGLLHGGVLYSLLDETMGWAATLQRTWVMTGRLEIRYLSPAPIGRPIRVTARVTRRRGRALEISGEAQVDGGPPVARASGLFMQVPDDLLRQVSDGVDSTQVSLNPGFKLPGASSGAE
ncbi:MAG TPA: PaaI family thioesterase [Dehalococcoidia bacterium]|nr:PaaI family thioesterase [Dehalococcoidia bacterium]